jgi:hypothetical protein
MLTTPLWTMKTRLILYKETKGIKVSFYFKTIAILGKYNSKKDRYRYVEK